jgi:hypothetical protein
MNLLSSFLKSKVGWGLGVVAAGLTAFAQTDTQTTASSGVEKTSFEAVTSRLDPGGRFFLYLSTEQWLAHLSDEVGQLRQFVFSLPGFGAGPQAQIGKLFDLVTQLIKHSGIEQISGVGASSIAKEPGFYRNKLFSIITRARIPARFGPVSERPHTDWRAWIFFLARRYWPVFLI